MSEQKTVNNNKPRQKRNYTPNPKKVNENKVETNAFAYNTTLPYVYSVLGDYLDSSPHSIKEIRGYSRNPQYYNKELRDLLFGDDNGK